MKRAAVVLAGLVFCFGILVGAVQAADKFGYVDLSRSFSEYQKTKDFDKTLTDKGDTYGVEKEKKINDIKQLQDKLNLLNDKEKGAKRKELEDKVKAFEEADRQKRTDLAKEQDEKMRDILKDIEEAVKKYAEKEGYTLVFNDRVLVYQTKSMDITDPIIDILNKGYVKK
jgi:Skp family chaperone for outer membrane proteins